MSRATHSWRNSSLSQKEMTSCEKGGLTAPIASSSSCENGVSSAARRKPGCCFIAFHPDIHDNPFKFGLYTLFGGKVYIIGLSLGGQDRVSLRHDYKTEVCRIPCQHADQLHL